jgi:hypothetical protein
LSTTALSTVLTAVLMMWVLQSHLRCRIRVRDCSNHALGISFHVLDPNVGRCHLEEECSVHRGHNFLVHCIGERYALVTSQYQASRCHA